MGLEFGFEFGLGLDSRLGLYLGYLESRNAGNNSRQNQGKKTPVVGARVENGQQQNSFSRVAHDGGRSVEQRKTESAMERWSIRRHQRTRT